MRADLVKSADLQGKTLTGLKGAKLGVVREAYLDLETGAIAFLVVEAAGLFRGAGKFQPVPWESVRYDSVADVFLTEMDKDRFKEAPSYDREQLANASYGWGDQVRRYFSPGASPRDEAPFQQP
ncbi:MAG: PRC-barrel domain-containing protein [Phenylobacterium sp.]